MIATESIYFLIAILLFYAAMLIPLFFRMSLRKRAVAYFLTVCSIALGFALLISTDETPQSQSGRVTPLCIISFILVLGFIGMVVKYRRWKNYKENFLGQKVKIRSRLIRKLISNFYDIDVEEL